LMLGARQLRLGEGAMPAVNERPRSLQQLDDTR
jgi:hypothetical protein